MSPYVALDYCRNNDPLADTLGYDIAHLSLVGNKVLEC